MLIMPSDSAPAYRSGFVRWRANDDSFRTWQSSGLIRAEQGSLKLDPAVAPQQQVAATDYDDEENLSFTGSFLVGEGISQPFDTPFPWNQAIVSWNADTPSGSWLETCIRAKLEGNWTDWYSLGIWASDCSTVARHSVNKQHNQHGRVSVDTLLLQQPADALQIKVRLFSADGQALPQLYRVGATFSTGPRAPAQLQPGDPLLWNRVLEVPACSQMIYPDGGSVWCSPTCLSMVICYWNGFDGQCEQHVRAAVDGVFDQRYAGHGNWPFNTAYAATQGAESYVMRLSSMAQAEAWIAQGIPLILSLSWKPDQLTGAPINTSTGHLIVLVGFDAAGNPIVNDPAAPTDQTVRRTYLRTQLEGLWLEHSGGTVYVLYPPEYRSPLDNGR